MNHPQNYVVENIDDENNIKIKNVCASIASFGVLWISNKNRSNQLGICNENTGDKYDPISVSNLYNLFKIFYGNTNTVYSTSSNTNSGGDGYNKNNIDYDGKQKKIEKLQYKQIIKIAAGYYHTLFLESNGILWCCGNNILLIIILK